ncbi:hypothetical protein J3459_018321 [Metarhizium acridum]|nr:hypothetical protein J3459_018321 [Metarhizium acridum]
MAISAAGYNKVGIPTASRASRLRVSRQVHSIASSKILMPEAEQTNNGDFESIGYHMFPSVDYDRNMSWKGGTGRIGIGVGDLAFKKTESYTENVLLPRGQNVLVMDTVFKLVSKT